MSARFSFSRAPRVLGCHRGAKALHTRLLGERGPLLVFLPGLGGTTRYWEGRVAPLASTHRLLLVDLLGFGRSPKPWWRYTLDRHLDALHRVLEGRGPFTLVGHSLGAALSLAYAARHPEAVEGLVLFSPPHFGSVEVALRHLRRSGTFEHWLMTNAVLTALACVLTRRVFGRLLPRLLNDLPREVAEDLVQHTWLSSTSSLWEVIYRHDLAQDVARLPAGLPVHSVHGARDRTAPLRGGLALARPHTNWVMTILPEVDHHPLLRAPEACLGVLRLATGSIAVPSPATDPLPASDDGRPALFVPRLFPAGS